MAKQKEMKMPPPRASTSIHGDIVLSSQPALGPKPRQGGVSPHKFSDSLGKGYGRQSWKGMRTDSSINGDVDPDWYTLDREKCDGRR
jgi:hypothetical protein